MGNLIGIDMGGTTITGGLVEDDHIIKHTTVDTRADEGGEVTLNILKDLIRSLKDKETVGIGIGVPSVVDKNKGIVYNVQNIRDWDEVLLKELLEAEFGIPVYIDNDANCFAYGEKIFGKGKEFKNFVGITLGTGVGGGIIQNNYLLLDSNCSSGEFGELPYRDSILEEYCGSRFFTRETGKSAYELALLAKQGDVEAINIYKEYGSHISKLVKIVMLILDPEAIIFGGSIAKSFDLFEQSMYDNLKDFPYPKSVEKIKILTSDIQIMGVLGACALCFV